MFTPRITWPDLPEHVSAEVIRVMGAGVVEWQGQTGGFSPGTADRLLLDDGRRVFCKAVSASMNSGSAELYRREIAANRVLPAGLPAPAMLHGAELADDWVLLLFDDIDGRHPHLPWHEDEFRAALASVAQVSALCPQASSDLPSVDDMLGDGDLRCFDEVAKNPSSTLDPWVREHLDELCDRAAKARAAISGTALCQLDARADNMVLDQSGKVWLVDWPWACRGAAWLDGALLAMTAAGAGTEFDLDPVIDEYAASKGATSDDVTNLWAGELGYFVQIADQPPPPSLPTIRAYQAQMRDSLTLALLRRLSRAA